MATIDLWAKKGQKTWCTKILNENLDRDKYISGKWGKIEGLLKFEIIEPGYYISHDQKIKYWCAELDSDSGNILVKEVKKSDVLNYFLLNKLSHIKQKREYILTVISYAPKNTGWHSVFTPCGDCFFAENENFVLLSGHFTKQYTKYIRNFTQKAETGEKRVALENVIYDKRKDNIKIDFLDENMSIITKPVTIDENSKITKGPLDFVFINNGEHPIE